VPVRVGVTLAVATGVLVGIGVSVEIDVGGIGTIVRVGGTGVIVDEGGIFVAGSLVTVCGERVAISVGVKHAVIKKIINEINNTNLNGLLNIFPPFDLRIPQIIHLKYYSTFMG